MEILLSKQAEKDFKKAPEYIQRKLILRLTQIETEGLKLDKDIHKVTLPSIPNSYVLRIDHKFRAVGVKESTEEGQEVFILQGIGIRPD